MDSLWSAWSCLCCTQRNAIRSALFVKKYFCCARNIYVPPGLHGNSSWKPFFVDGEVISANITGQYSICLEDSYFQYDFKHDRTTIDSLQKEEPFDVVDCCSCHILNRGGQFCCSARPVLSKIIPQKEEEDDHPYILALQHLMEFNEHTSVGLFRFRTWGQGDPREEPLIAERFREALKAVKLTVPFLQCTVAQQGYEPWVELADYKHLSLRTKEKVEVTEKMLNCGFLSITAVMSNPEKLSEFRGFGLIIGFISKNGITWDRLFEEIELWKNKTPSTLECFGLFDRSDIPRPHDLFERLSSYSITGKMLKSDPPHNEIDVITLDDKNDAAIMSMHGTGVCFVRGGWEKWKEVFYSLGESIVQFHDF